MNIEKFNLFDLAKNTSALFTYRQVGILNDHMLNIVSAKDRTLDFHVHEESDEMFFIIEGTMQIEFTDSRIDLHEGDCIIVPRGTMHRPVCNQLVKVMLIEKSGTLNNDNTGGAYAENERKKP